MSKSLSVLLFISTLFVLGCQNPANNDVLANNPPNPPVLPAFDNVPNSLYILKPSPLNKILNLTYSNPADPDSGNTVSMKILSVNMVDYTSHSIVRTLDADLAGMNPRFTDPVNGVFQIDGVSGTVHDAHNTAGDAVGVEVCVFDNHGSESDPVMLVFFIDVS